ncbi:CvpA family protein [Sulfurospirillum sp. 1612]|uniref:CvpA family protein n=1 Tax=Sulfurospirillum sp. 1612 TaxID=3094835 RepID=UPI002F9452AF
MDQVSIFDIVSLSLILILGIKGVINGFIKEVFGLIGIVGGIYVATRFAETTGQFIDTNIYAFGNKASLYLIGFIATLLLVWILSIIIGYILSHLLKASGLSGLDKLAGFLVGSLKIFLVFSILAIALTNVEFVRSRIQKYMDKSFMYPIFLETGKYIVKINTDDIVEKISGSPENNTSK